MTTSPEALRLIDQIRDDTTHGASELARQALKVFQVLADDSRAVDGSQFREEVRDAAARLMAVRPSMAPLSNSVSRLVESFSAAAAADPGPLREVLRQIARDLIDSSLRATSLIAGYTAGLVEEGETVLTHSYSSTVCAALAAAQARHNIRVIVTRSGAGRTGVRSALELFAAGLQVTFIDDTAVGIFVSRCNRVIVGADRICRDGGLVNGIGTRLVALAAAKAGIPFFVLCETLKFDGQSESSGAVLEEKGPDEVISRGILPAGISVKNPYFDVTPVELITAFVIETGVIRPSGLEEFFARRA